MTSRRAFGIGLALAMVGWTVLAHHPTAVAAATVARVGSGPLAGTKHVAGRALSEKSCSGLTKNRLTALMLSIPPWELLNGDTTVTLSPLSLSRWDGWANPKNRPLYSHGTYGGYKRAHWNPGVGLWQLDTWSPTITLNHGERVNAGIGGLRVARYLRDGFCAGTSTLKRRLNGTWFACRTDKCWNTYTQIYNATNDTLSVIVDTTVNQWDGGQTTHRCRWGAGSDQSTFTCRYVNVNRKQGYADVNDVEGIGSRSPLAYPFLSFTSKSSHNKYAAWLRAGTNYDIEIVRWEPETQNARYGGNWYNGTSLQVWKCKSSRCWWSNWGLEP